VRPLVLSCLVVPRVSLVAGRFCLSWPHRMRRLSPAAQGTQNQSSVGRATVASPMPCDANNGMGSWLRHVTVTVRQVGVGTQTELLEPINFDPLALKKL